MGWGYDDGDNVPPMHNQRAIAIPIEKTIILAGQQNEFWNILTFSPFKTIYRKF